MERTVEHNDSFFQPASVAAWVNCSWQCDVYNRENMSKALSPRLVFSTTIGTKEASDRVEPASLPAMRAAP